MKEIKSFLGTGWSFPPRFDEETSALMMVSEEEDIRESLFLLLSTTPGERITNPKYGCDLRRFIFKPILPDIESSMKDVIRRSILFYEPRVTVDDIVIDSSSSRDGLVMIHLYYTVVSINIRTNMVYPFYLVEGTDIVEE